MERVKKKRDRDETVREKKREHSPGERRLKGKRKSEDFADVKSDVVKAIPRSDVRKKDLFLTTTRREKKMLMLWNGRRCVV